MLHKDLKQLMEDACFAYLGKLFQNLAPQYEEHFCPFDVFFFGICTSESVFLRLWDEEFEFLVQRSIKYWSANLRFLESFKAYLEVKPSLIFMNLTSLFCVYRNFSRRLFKK